MYRFILFFMAWFPVLVPLSPLRADTTQTLAVDATGDLPSTLILSFTFSFESTAVQAAVSLVSVTEGQIISALTGFGIEADDIDIKAYTITRVTDEDNITKFVVKETLSTQQPTTLISSIQTILSQILPLDSSIEFSLETQVGGTADAFNAALVEAYENAATSASLLATAGGFTLGNVLSIRNYSDNLHTRETLDLPIATTAKTTTADDSDKTSSVVRVRVVYEIK